MKKNMTLILVLILFLSFTGCQGINDEISIGSISGKTNELMIDKETENIKNVEEVEEIVELDEDATMFSVHFIDVGQGDSILIDYGNHGVLIDAGNHGDDDLVLDYLKKNDIQFLDYAILTHEDHIGSMNSIIDTIQIGNIMMPIIKNNTEAFEGVLDSVNNKGVTITKAIPGEEFEVNGTTFTILSPSKELVEIGDSNDASIVLKLSYNGADFLFTSDAELETIESIKKLYSMDFLDVDVLKLSNHGSRTSKDFIEISNPEIAIISAGKDNEYKYPHDETLELLTEHEVITYSTIKEGHIVFNIDTNGSIQKGE